MSNATGTVSGTVTGPHPETVTIAQYDPATRIVLQVSAKWGSVYILRATRVSAQSINKLVAGDAQRRALADLSVFGELADSEDPHVVLFEASDMDPHLELFETVVEALTNAMVARSVDSDFNRRPGFNRLMTSKRWRQWLEDTRRLAADAKRTLGAHVSDAMLAEANRVETAMAPFSDYVAGAPTDPRGLTELNLNAYLWAIDNLLSLGETRTVADSKAKMLGKLFDPLWHALIHHGLEKAADKPHQIHVTDLIKKRVGRFKASVKKGREGDLMDAVIRSLFRNGTRTP
jgi:hypothetical protein